MIVEPKNLLRLQFLVRVIGKENLYLQQTASRLFKQPLDATALQNLENNIALSEQLDAFAQRHLHRRARSETGAGTPGQTPPSQRGRRREAAVAANELAAVAGETAHRRINRRQ